jgi:hypothetical protein
LPETGSSSRATPKEPPEGRESVGGWSTGTAGGDFYPEEAPVQPVSVDGFWIDETAVTASAAHIGFRCIIRQSNRGRPDASGDSPR